MASKEGIGIREIPEGVLEDFFFFLGLEDREKMDGHEGCVKGQYFGRKETVTEKEESTGTQGAYVPVEGTVLVSSLWVPMLIHCEFFVRQQRCRSE